MRTVIREIRKRGKYVLLAPLLCLGLLAAGVTGVPLSAWADDATPMDLTSYITGAEIYYTYTENGETKTEKVETTTVIPKTATGLQIYVDFENVPKKTLREDHSNTLTYTLQNPIEKANVSDEAVLDSEGKQVGTIHVDENLVTITYDDSYTQDADENSTIAGNFKFNCGVSRDKTSEDPVTITIGDNTYSLTYDPVTTAETGELKVEKSTPVYHAADASKGEDPASTGYLEYTLTVKTGDDEMPDVHVEDTLTSPSNAGQFVSGFLVDGVYADDVTKTASLTGTETLTSGSPVSVFMPDGTTSNGTVTVKGSSPGKLYWQIGDMAANETRTLTYRIKLTDNYVGLYNKNVLKNTATPYSGEYAHASATSSFTPSENATVTKEASKEEDTDNGSTITVHYTVTITPDENNTWPIRNVKIADNLYSTYDKSGDGLSETGQKQQQAMNTYAKFQNFAIKSVNAEGTETEVALPIRSNGKANPDAYYRNKTNYNANYRWDPSFDMYVGDVDTDSKLVVTYDLVIDKQIFTAINKNAWNIGNNVTVRTDDSKDTKYGGNTSVGAAQSTQAIGSQVWDRKYSGTVITEDVTQSPEGQEPVTISAASKAIKYQVAVNETGKWDVTNATFEDTLGNHLQYKGYLQIDYYEEGISEGTGTNSTTGAQTDVTLSDADALSALQEKTPDATAYTSIDGKTSFAVKPSELLEGKSTGAYLLTYYVVPVDMETVANAYHTSNTFALTGDVTIGTGEGKQTYTLTESATKQVKKITIDGSSNFAAAKKAWYFNGNTDEAYWVIEGTGSAVPAGLSLRDVGNSTSTNPTLAAAFIGDSIDSDDYPAAYRSVEDFREAVGKTSGSSENTENTENNEGSSSEAEGTGANTDSGFRELTNGTDFTAKSTTGGLELSFDHALTIGDGQKLYIIVKTTRDLSGLKGDPVKSGLYTLQNSLQQEQGEGFETISTATLSTNGGGDAFKELGQVVTRDSDGNWKQITQGESKNANGAANLVTKDITEAGTYIDWRVKVNLIPNLDGSYTVSDTLPEGLEPVYVRYYNYGSDLTSDTAPTIPAIADLENNTDWKDIGLKQVGTSNGKIVSAYAYYNEETREIRFRVENLQNVMPATGLAAGDLGRQSLEVQILARVTDESAQMGESKTFANTISVKDDDGYYSTTDTSTVTVKQSSISKTSATLTSGQTDAGKVPFTITVNELGETLADGAETLTVVDELSDPLKFDLTSIKVTDADGKDVTDSISIEDHTESGTGINVLYFIVPNSTKLTISYTATPYVPLNSSFRLSNKAYWFGYPDGASSNSKNNVRYEVSSTASSNDPASITVSKRDASSIFNLVPGATYTLQEVDWNTSAGEWETAENSEAVTQTTGDDGTTTFSNLEYNTAYRLTEASAPDGYELDSTPQYLVVAKSTGGTRTNPTYPDEVKVYDNKGATVQYTGAKKMSASVFNIPTVTVTGKKVWDDADNQDGVRPQSITVQLLANGEAAKDDEGDPITQTVRTNGNSEWAFAFTGLPKYDDNDKEIAYTIAEERPETEAWISKYDEPVIAGSMEDGFTITNTHTPETITISGEKKWEDSNDQDGERPDAITVRLHAGGDVIETKTVSADDNWAYEFSDLPKYENEGDEIEYTVTEDTTESYSSVYSVETSEDDYDITNSYTPRKTTVTVSKQWNDADNQDGVRPDSVTIRLYADGTDTGKTLELSEDNQWMGTFSDLDEYRDGGTKIVYTVKEEETETGDLSKYNTDSNEPVITGDASQGYVVQNSHTPETTSVKVTKKWNDAKYFDTDGNAIGDYQRPDIKITLTGTVDGEAVHSYPVTLKADTVTTNDDGDWTYTWSDLPKYHRGKEITYTASESAADGGSETVAGYSAATGDDGLTITNTPREEEDVNEVVLHLHKVDGRTADSTGLEGAVFTLTDASGNERTYTTNANGNVSMTFTADGTYTLEETTPPTGYQRSDQTYTIAVNKDLVNVKLEGSTWVWFYNLIFGNREDTENFTYDSDSSTLTVSDIPTKTSVTAAKVWDDANNQDGKRPDRVDVTIQGKVPAVNDNGTVDDKIVLEDTVELSAENQWAYTWPELNKYYNGVKINYTVTEVRPETEKWTSEYEEPVITSSDDGYTITNRHEPEQTEVTVTKTWDDADNQDGKRPDNVTVRLLANGEPAVNEDGGEIMAELQEDENGKWTYTFDNLPKYSDGSVIQYTVLEDTVKDYSASYETTGDANEDAHEVDITNTHTPDQVSVSVAKAWNDGGDADGIRPKSVTVRLYADGEDTGKTLKLSKSNDWVSSFTELDQYRNGKEIKYTIREDAVDGYETSVSGSMDKGYAIVNTHEATKTTGSSNPKTGDHAALGLWMALFSAAGAAAIFLGLYRRRKA